MVASSPAIHVDSAGRPGPATRSPIPNRNCAPLRSNAGRIPRLAVALPAALGLLYDRPAVATGNVVTDNLIVLSDPPRFTDGGEAAEQDLARTAAR